MRRIVCAAIRAEDGDLLLGIHHYSQDMLKEIEARPDGEKFYHRHKPDQGFVDQSGIYLTRDEAWIVAEAAGQIIRDCSNPGTLYSENLY